MPEKKMKPWAIVLMLLLFLLLIGGLAVMMLSMLDPDFMLGGPLPTTTPTTAPTTAVTTRPTTATTAATTVPTTAGTTLPTTLATTVATTASTTAPTSAATTVLTTKATTAASTQAAHKHSYTAKKIAATCTEKGYTLHTCSCGKSYQDSTVKALGHSYGNAVFTPAAGQCEGSGENVFTCTVCGNTKKETVHGKHVYGEWQYVASTFIGENLFGEETEYSTHSARFRVCTKCHYKHYEYFKDHKCAYGKPTDNFVRKQIDTGCKNRVIDHFTCDICGYVWEKEAVDPRTGDPLYGAHKYVHTEKVITELTATTDGYTLITDVCSVCNYKKWQVRDECEVPSTHEAWNTKYEIQVRFSDSYDHNLKMSGTGDPEPRWTEHPEWLKKYTNFKYDGETGYLLEYTVIWWSENGNRYETVINIQDCYELYLEAIEEGRVTLPEGRKPENCIAKFNVSTFRLSFITIAWA